ncbi:hypothetical protein ACFVWG_16880 [Kribbella sp. NPDC058245]|uniref:hypothetical protein n=1 Tax=Kribbella sp. NPDC058245 TaxID=3346399 RepID=UPI0036F18615
MTDLRDLLRSAAAEAENVSVDGSALIPTIRRRRRVRSAAVGVGGVTAVTTLALGAYAVLPGAGPSDASVSGGAPSATSSFQSSDCEPIYISEEATVSAKTELTQKSMRRTGKTTWSGTVEVKLTNPAKVTLHTPNAPYHYVIVPEKGDQRVTGRAQAKVTQEDVVLRPGASHTSTVQLTVQSCAKGQAAAGSYLIYQSTMEVEGNFYWGKAVKGSEPVGRLQLS